jgi:hypothetical protein
MNRYNVTLFVKHFTLYLRKSSTTKKFAEGSWYIAVADTKTGTGVL